MASEQIGPPPFTQFMYEETRRSPESETGCGWPLRWPHVQSSDRQHRACTQSRTHPIISWSAFIVSMQDLGRTQLCMASEQLEGAQLSPEGGEISEVKQLNKVPKTYDDQRKNIKLCSLLKEQLSGQASCVDPQKGSRSLVLFQEEEGTVKQINPSYSREYVTNLLIGHFPPNVSKMTRSRKT